MRALRDADPEAYKQKQRDYHYHGYHTDPEFKARALQRFKDRQAPQDALLLPDQTKQKKSRGRPPVAILDDNLNLVAVN